MKSEKSTFRGIVRNVNWREKGGEHPIDILAFRIERVDSEGNLIDYIPVTMEGRHIKGNVVDGDEVEVTGKIDKEGLLNAESIHNLGTHAYIKVKKTSAVAIFSIFLVVIFFIYIFLAMVFSGL
jgi:hypothetical protein